MDIGKHILFDISAGVGMDIVRTVAEGYYGVVYQEVFSIVFDELTDEVWNNLIRNGV